MNTEKATWSDELIITASCFPFNMHIVSPVIKEVQLYKESRGLVIQAAPFCLGRRPQQVRHCGVLLSTVSHVSGLADRSPIDPDCGWLCSDKCWLSGSERMGTERGRRREGGVRRWGHYCFPVVRRHFRGLDFG